MMLDSFLQEFKISLKLRFKICSQKKKKKKKKIHKNPENRGNHSHCYKNQLLCSIWDIWWHQWLQAIAN